MGITNISSINTTFNNAWNDLAKDKLVSHYGLNIISGKDRWRISKIQSSPFANIIIAVEKESYFTLFGHIPKLFHCTLIPGGGQPSEGAAERFVDELEEEEVDLFKPFHLFTISDLDPAGRKIAKTFERHLRDELKKRTDCEPKISRDHLFLKMNQVTPQLIEHYAVPFKHNAKTEQAKKAETTKYRNFVAELGEKLLIDGIPHKVELEAIPDQRQVDIITDALLKHIHDHSLIMIPEIIAEVEKAKEDAIDQIYSQKHYELIEPLVAQHIEKVKEKSEEIEDEFTSEYDDITESYEEEIDELQSEADELTKTEINEQKKLREKIKELEAQVDELEDVICENTEKQRMEIYNLRESRDKELSELNVQVNRKRRVLSDLVDVKRLEFNPTEQRLKDNVKKAVLSKKITFEEIEADTTTKPHIAKLLTNPDALLVDEVSCLKQAAPVFLEKDALRLAAGDNASSISAYRKAFSSGFIGAIKSFTRKSVQDVEIKPLEIGELGISKITHEEIDAALSKGEGD